jgi:hypothetical protein
VDEATWAALAAVLTVAGLAWTWVAFRRRGVASGLRALGFAVLPAAAWLTGTLRMFTEIAQAVGRWAGGLVLNPAVWTGISLAGLSLVLFVVSGYLRDRQLARGRAAPADRSAVPGRDRGEELPEARSTRGSGQSSAPADPEMAEIEELLRRRGIS